MRPLVVRTFDMGKGQAAKGRQLAAGSPVLPVLVSNGDIVPDWLARVRSLARVLLLARSHDVWASFLNQPMELAELRMRPDRSGGISVDCSTHGLRSGSGHDTTTISRRSTDARSH
jgi:hypothetical protein